MRQILQNLGSGETLLAEVPCPAAGAGRVLIQTRASLVSVGTERMLLDFGRAGWIEKARKQPDKVLQVLAKIRTDGLLPTVAAVRAKLDQPIALGYANVGIVLQADGPAGTLRAGDRVVSNGPHAEVVSVPRNLCVRVPDDVPDEAAAFTVIASIGLEGIRLIQPSLGETVVVTGLGLIGLLSVQLLRAHGCRVLGIDFDPAKCALARQFGAETVELAQGGDPVAAALGFTQGRGVDAVLITAASQSSEPVCQAAHMCRKRGRIVLVGVTGLELSRADFYEKELSFQVSCSYGPGRYDPEYEEKGHDYPIGFVRWTEQRNFEAVLDMLADGRVNVEPLITHRYPFDQALTAYEALGAKAMLGVVLAYRQPESGDDPLPERLRAREVPLAPPRTTAAPIVVGVIGSGNFAGQVLLPELKRIGVRLKTIASAGGVSGTHLGRKFGFETSTTDAGSLFEDPEINTVFVMTRHDSHARFVARALASGKSVYVEKPLAIDVGSLEELESAFSSQGSGGVVMVGYNRRFAPQIVRLKALLAAVAEPKCLIMTVNAGALPDNHWHYDPKVGGGRIVSEGCHFVDLLRHLVGAPITSATAECLGRSGGMRYVADKASITLKFADGSLGVVHYFGNGSRQFPKERLEVFCAGRVLQLDNFKRLSAFGWPGFRKMNLWTQDKGHAQGLRRFLETVRNGERWPIPAEELLEVSRVCLTLEGALAG